ncbi:integrase [Mesorhizobium sp. Cs1299R1N1]|uniref:tyrosine-type recombinase/integrase n=1 Tax=Mesorhizobium sp. Cs1299R1N1 TaxID=3015172 RepID=UPI00301CEFF8
MGERIKLPNDPHSPEFWVAVRQAQGIVGPVATDTISALIDAYEAAWPGLPRKLADSTKEKYRQSLRVVREAWGNLQAESLRPSHVQALIETLGATKPGTANNVLDALRAMCRWACGPREFLSRDPTQGVTHFEQGEGHKPWTPEQLAFASDNLTGMLRRAYVLGRYTGQRISDLVRLGWTDIDDGGFNLRQKKTGARPWCPIFSELEVEMSTWEKRPGPFLLQETGKPFTTNGLWKKLDKVREDHPQLAGAVWHGLRANAVIRLRQDGYTSMQISDAVGMSIPMVERYSRYADRKAGGQAILLSMKERKQDKTVKR